MLYGILHVCIELLDKLQEGLYLVLKNSFEGAMKVDDDLERKNSIVLVVVAKDIEHGGHEGVGVGFEVFLLRETMYGFESDMAKTLLWCFCGEAAWCGIEQ